MITLLVIVAFVALVVTSTRLGEASSQRCAGVGVGVVAIHYAAWVAQLGMDATDVAWRQPIEAGLHVLAALGVAGFAVVLVRRATDPARHALALLVIAGVEVWCAVGALGAPRLERADVTVEQRSAKLADGRRLVIGMAALEPGPQRIEITWRANGDLLDVRPLDPPRARTAGDPVPEASYAGTPARHGGSWVVVASWILLGIGVVGALASFGVAARRAVGAHIVAVVALLVIAPLAWRIHGDELRLALAGERVTAVVTDRYENLVKEAKRSTFLERVVQARWIDDDGAPHLASGVVSDELWEHVELGSRVDVTVVRDAPHLHVIGREVPGSLILLLVTVCGIAILLVAVWLMAF